MRAISRHNHRLSQLPHTPCHPRTLVVHQQQPTQDMLHQSPHYRQEPSQVDRLAITAILRQPQQPTMLLLTVCHINQPPELSHNHQSAWVAPPFHRSPSMTSQRPLEQQVKIQALRAICHQ